jgi:hypothetical protein
MKKELIRQVSEDYISQSKELKRLWMEYVKEKKEIKLNGLYVTMWDGAGERMDRLTYHDGEVIIVDVFGSEYSFEDDAGFEALAELYYFMFVDNQSSEE